MIRLLIESSRRNALAIIHFYLWYNVVTSEREVYT